MQFNVGDRVRVVYDKFYPEKVGKTGVIAEDDRTSLPYRVRFDDAAREWDFYWASELELVSDSTVFKLPVPEEPAGVDRVRPVGVGSRFVFSRDPSFPEVWSEGPGYRKYGWRELLERFPNGVEPVPAESDFEVSLDYLRRNAHLLDGLEASGVTGSHAAAVVRGVLAKEGSE